MGNRTEVRANHLLDRAASDLRRYRPRRAICGGIFAQGGTPAGQPTEPSENITATIS